MAAKKKKQVSVLELKKEAAAIRKKLDAKQKQIRKEEGKEGDDFISSNRSVIDSKIIKIAKLSKDINSLVDFYTEIENASYELEDLHLYLDSENIEVNMRVEHLNFGDTLFGQVEEALMSVSSMQEKIEYGDFKSWFEKTKRWHEGSKKVKQNLPKLLTSLEKEARFLCNMLEDTHG